MPAAKIVPFRRKSYINARPMPSPMPSLISSLAPSLLCSPIPLSALEQAVMQDMFERWGTLSDADRRKMIALVDRLLRTFGA